jgi:hypothetical protein
MILCWQMVGTSGIAPSKEGSKGLLPRLGQVNRPPISFLEVWRYCRQQRLVDRYLHVFQTNSDSFEAHRPGTINILCITEEYKKNKDLQQIWHCDAYRVRIGRQDAAVELARLSQQLTVVGGN